MFVQSKVTTTVNTFTEQRLQFHEEDISQKEAFLSFFFFFSQDQTAPLATSVAEIGNLGSYIQYHSFLYQL